MAFPGLLGGLAGAGAVVAGADQAQNEALKRALVQLQLRQAQQQDQSLASIYGGALNLGPPGRAPIPSDPPQMPQGMPSAQPGQVQQQPLAPPSAPPPAPGGMPQQAGLPFGAPAQPPPAPPLQRPVETQVAGGLPDQAGGPGYPVSDATSYQAPPKPPAGGKAEFAAEKTPAIHPAVQREIQQTGMEAIRSGLPAPGVREAVQSATGAGATLDPSRLGSYSAPEIAQAIEKATPNAPVAVKALALMQLHKMMAPDQQQLVRIMMQQQRNELQTELTKFRADTAERRLQETLSERRREFDTRQEQAPGQVFQSPEGGFVRVPTRMGGGPVEAIPGLEAGSTRVGTGGAATQTGETLFKQLQAARASGDAEAVKAASQAIADHNAALGKGVGTRGGAQAQYMQQYKQEHPNSTAAEMLQATGEYRRINALETGFANGMLGRNVVSLNTVSDHLKLAREYFEALNNGQLPRANQIANFLAVESGKPEVTSFRAGRDIMADEVVRLLTSTGGTEADRKGMQGRLADFQSPEQGRGVLTTLDKFVAGRFSALEQQYAQGDEVRRERFQGQLLTPESRELYNRTKGQGAAGGAAAKSGPPYKAGDTLTIEGKQYRVTGGDPNDPDIEAVR